MNIHWELIENYRKSTYRISLQDRLCTAEDAIHFVNQRGFIFFWPGSDVPLPSLWNATAGNRPVPDEHDDPGNITWEWKDSLLDKKVWYYGRILDNRNTIISLEMIPYFYALTPNYGDYEFDYLESYNMGYMTNSAKTIYEALLENGPMDTLALRKVSRMTGEKQKGAFLKSLNDLQRSMHVMPVGISRSGGWRYAFIYDISARHLPDLQEKTKTISEEAAIHIIARKYLKSVGAVQARYFYRLFHWSDQTVKRVLTELVEEHFCYAVADIDQRPGKWVILTEMS